MRFIKVEKTELDLFLKYLGSRLSLVDLMNDIGFYEFRKVEDAIDVLKDWGYELTEFDWLDNLYEYEYKEYREEILNYLFYTHILFYEGEKDQWGSEMVYIGIPALGSGEYLEWNQNRFIDMVNNCDPDIFQLVTDLDNWYDNDYTNELD